MRTNLFVCTVRRFAVGTPSGRALRTTDRTLAVGRDDLGTPVQACPVHVIARALAPVAISLD